MLIFLVTLQRTSLLWYTTWISLLARICPLITKNAPGWQPPAVESSRSAWYSTRDRFSLAAPSPGQSTVRVSGPASFCARWAALSVRELSTGLAQTLPDLHGLWGSLHHVLASQLLSFHSCLQLHQSVKAFPFQSAWNILPLPGIQAVYFSFK